MMLRRLRADTVEASQLHDLAMGATARHEARLVLCDDAPFLKEGAEFHFHRRSKHPLEDWEHRDGAVVSRVGGLLVLLGEKPCVADVQFLREALTESLGEEVI